MKWAAAACLLVSVSLAACSGSSSRGTLPLDGGGGMGTGGSASGGSGGTTSTGGTTSGIGGIALSVSAASSPSQVDNSSPSGGNAFEQLDITLQNKSSSTPVPMNFALFTLGTDQSLVLSSSGLSGTLVPECSPTTSVATGGSFSCKLVFEIPTGQTATTLYYDDKQGHQASAPVPAPAAPPPPSACEQSAAVLVSGITNPSSACGQCVANEQGTGSPDCFAQNATAQSACVAQNCYSQCLGTGGATPASFCSCYQSCATAACWTAAQSDMECIAKACASSCP